MNYALKVLNNDATLNNFEDIGSASIYKGATAEIVMQLFQADRKIRYIPDAGAVITLDLKKSDDTVLTKTATFPFDPADRSIIKITLTALETADLITQKLVAKIVEGSDTSFAAAPMGLQMGSTTSEGC